MSYRRRPARWRASVVFLSFCLETKGPKVQGRLHRTSPRLSKRLTLRSRSAFCEGKRQAPLREGQPFSHPLRALPRHVGRVPRAQPGRSLAFPHTVSVVIASFLNGTFPLLAVIAGADPRSPMLLGFTPVVASRHREARSDPFMTDLCKICFKKNINFIPSYLPDNKRLQTTTVDYKRLINGLVLTRIASLQR